MGSIRVERRKEKTRESIKSAALQIALEKRIEELTMDEVAERADVARGTVYNLFESRSALISEALAPLMVRIAERAEVLPAAARVEDLAGILSDAWAEGKGEFELTLSVKESDMTAPGAEPLKEAHDRLIAAYLGAVARVAANERFRIVSPRAVAFLIFRVAAPLLRALAEEGADLRPSFAAALRGLLCI